MTKRVPCKKCKAKILPTTAETYDGLCKPCFNLSVQREKMKKNIGNVGKRVRTMDMDIYNMNEDISLLDEIETYWCPIGQNGQTIKLEASALCATEWLSNPGIYMLATISQGLRILYVGQTDNFRADPLMQQKSEEAIQQGARLALSKVVENPVERERLKNLIVQVFQPPMNLQDKK